MWNVSLFLLNSSRYLSWLALAVIRAISIKPVKVKKNFFLIHFQVKDGELIGGKFGSLRLKVGGSEGGGIKIQDEQELIISLIGFYEVIKIFFFYPNLAMQLCS